MVPKWKCICIDLTCTFDLQTLPVPIGMVKIPLNLLINPHNRITVNIWAISLNPRLTYEVCTCSAAAALDLALNPTWQMFLNSPHQHHIIIIILRSSTAVPSISHRPACGQTTRLDVCWRKVGSKCTADANDVVYAASAACFKTDDLLLLAACLLCNWTTTTCQDQCHGRATKKREKIHSYRLRKVGKMQNSLNSDSIHVSW